MVGFVGEEKLLVQDVGVFSQLEGALVEVLFCSFVVFPSPAQPQQQVVLDIFQLNCRDPPLDDSLPEGIDVHLQQRHGPYQQVVARSDQIDIKQQMVPHQTVHPLIVGNRVSGPELNNDLLVRVAWQDSSGVVERKDVAGVGEELELGVELAVVVQGEDLCAGVVQLDLPEVDGVAVEKDVEPFGVALQLEGKGVAVVALQVEGIDCGEVGEAWGVVDLHRKGGLGGNRASFWVETEEAVVELGHASLGVDGKGRRHFSAVAQHHLPTGSPGD